MDRRSKDMEKKTIRVSIQRSSPSSGEPPWKQVYQVEEKPGATVLSVLKDIYENQDPTLAYYVSCRLGKCAGCQVLVNGRVRLACTEPVEGDLELAPQPGYPVIRDLYVDKRKKSGPAGAG